MDRTILAYIADFLDGDGSIFFQLVRRKDYIFGYQIRCSVSFYQRSDNQKILHWLKTQLKSGYIRHRKTGISDYTIVQPKEVNRILQTLKPYVQLKKQHIKLGLKIIDKLSKVSDANSFLELCRMVDSFKILNYSTNRTITSEVVEKFLKENNLLTPVETSSVKDEILSIKRKNNTPVAFPARKG